MKAIACSAPYGSGGLGQHLAQIVEQARTDSQLTRYYSLGIKPDDPSGQPLKVMLFERLLRYTPLRYSPGWTNYLLADLFDRAVACHLIPVEHFAGFGGQSLHSFQRARALGAQVLELQAANSHICNVRHQHRKAIQRFGIEKSWLNEAQCHKTLQEYALADVIHVASEYTRQTFLAEGFPSEKLYLHPLRVHPRFRPSPQRPQDGIFRVVYVGSLTVMKGIPLLLEAFAQFADKDTELHLVGGWASGGMRRYLQGSLACDGRLRIVSGDPLPHLQQADVLVHPTYEDGFAYAPMEALACGVPVIVSADTGMKDFVREGINGYVVPTGDGEAILERLLAIRQAPLVSHMSLSPSAILGTAHGDHHG
ncbi:glycosyltransferase family 4 protein [Anthocerotibacter panamensis]|uniref:glycosyltransferase family 4 protein n=1 Tax=Anthocerotibacter panamensis TaxID=2857077 RepID=UPI001C408C05|nr:glycosyltransferase family 4 protein [Anthocerotibacter panamensis]